MEKEIVRRYSGGIGWPTIVFAAGLLAVDSLSIWAWTEGRLPLGAALLINSVVAYASYTVHHDATHKSISGRNPRFAWLDTACGTFASAFVLLEFKGYASNHLRHHAHVNGENDPDLLVKGPLLQVPVKWAMLMTFAVLGSVPWVGDKIVGAILNRILPRDVKPPLDSEGTRHRMRRINQIALAIVLVSVPLGLFVPVFFLWYLPSRIGILLLMVLFQWLPHFPFERTDRWGATHATTFPFSTWLLLQQDRHHVHHLYPSIPWYRYRAAFRELRPIIEYNSSS